MWSKIKRAFTPPVFEDEDKTRIANLLSVTILVIFLIAVARTILAIGAAPGYQAVVFSTNAILIGVLAGVFILMHTGYVRTACFVFTFYQWLSIAWLTYRYGGVSLSVYSFFIFVILSAGLLLGGRWAVGFATITIIYGTLLLYLEFQGLISPLPETSLAVFSTVTPSFITTAVLVYLYHRDILRALTRARDNASQLALANEQLTNEIAAREKAEEQLVQAQKMEAIGRLSGGIAHDFNNLLIPIIGYVELGMMNLSPDSQLYNNLNKVKEAADRAANLTRQILAFSRQQILEVEVIDLNEIIIEFQQMIQHMIREDIELKTNLAPSLHRIRADKSQIEQVLMNLVVNARDAMPCGGKLTIETDSVFLDVVDTEQYVDMQAPGHYVTLTVSDTGRGMDAETKKQIFEPFFTTKERDQGTGLGLATVFGIVKQHQGNVWVYSEPDKGSTFKIYLPKAEETDPIKNITASEPAKFHGIETVLVVEDEKVVRKLICDTLRTHGYNVIEAKSADDGLQLATDYENTIHLLLTDVIMPGMNGQELYQKVVIIRPDIKVLYMSGYTDDVIAHHGMLDGSVNFLQKPFTVDVLTQKIRQVLG